MTINLPDLSGVLPPRRPGAPQGNKHALGHGPPRGNKNGVGHGAPRGNRNALKFGIYTREFTRPIAQPPGMSLLESLELEKHRLRHYIRDKLASVNPASLDYGSHLALLRAATIAVDRIRRLHRHILRIQASHAFESHLGRSIAGELALSPAHAQESGLLPSPFSPLPSSVFHNNCLLVPLFSHNPPPRSGRNRDWGIRKPSFEIISDSLARAPLLHTVTPPRSGRGRGRGQHKPDFEKSLNIIPIPAPIPRVSPLQAERIGNPPAPRPPVFIPDID